MTTLLLTALPRGSPEGTGLGFAAPFGTVTAVSTLPLCVTPLPASHIFRALPGRSDLTSSMQSSLPIPVSPAPESPVKSLQWVFHDTQSCLLCGHRHSSSHCKGTVLIP